MKHRLATYDLASGETDTVLVTARHIEAPNWHPSGGFLVVNGDGALFRVDLDAPALVPIETGGLNRLNNDHGISPDGKIFVLSNHTREGKSCIYTVPVSGGTPKCVTENVPSWWHGWSPDGKMLTYTAVRNNVFDIFTIPVGGGVETRVTSGDFDHADGPDYSADGTWIWFNAERDGTSDLWRIRPDGSDLEKMTDDDRINWFPHPSPDGKSILYLAYEKGVAGHPAQKHVELRLLPAGGGEPKILKSLFGGQGTINVPCWAPDSKKFAYVEILKEDGS